MTNFKTLLQLNKKFQTNEDCILYYEGIRFGDQKYCPHCASVEYYTLKRKFKYRCKGCKKDFNVFTGTIFENTKIGLPIWFASIYLATTGKKGISSVQLANQLGITQKTAWFVLHRIREMLADKAPRLLTGVVEVDETAIGGKDKFRHKSKKRGHTGVNAKNSDKIMVGAVEKNGKVVTRHIPEGKAHIVRPFVIEVIEEGATLVTDESTLYKSFKGRFVQQKVNHHKEQYVNKKGYTTNHIENYWSTLKRGIYGIYHQISEKHTQRYLDEFSFRYNSREEENEGRFCLALKQSDSRLTYQRLIGK